MTGRSQHRAPRRAAVWAGRAAGMTLVEIMVVLTIVAMMMGLGVISMRAVTGSNLRDDAGRVTAAIKYTYANAAINNTQYRLVFDLDTGKYWTEVAKKPIVDDDNSGSESAPGGGGTDGSSSDYLTEEAQQLAEKVQKKNDLFDDAEANPFGINRKVTYKRVKDAVLDTTHLKKGDKFAKIVKANNQEEYTSGKVSMTFFPNGFQEQVMIVLHGPDDGAVTLITEPLTGRVRTYTSELDVPEDFGKVETDE